MALDSMMISDGEHEEDVLDLGDELPMDEDVLELSEPIPEPTPEPEPEPVFELPKVQEDVVDFQPPPEPEPYFEPPPPPKAPEEPLVSPHVAHASTNLLAELARAVARERGIGVGVGGGITLEDMVRELLRPILKDWLDANLPYLIERMVKQEIERMVDRTSKY